MRTLWLVVLGIYLHCVTAFPRDEFFPFDTVHGDSRLPIGDDIHSDEFHLKTPLTLYDQRYGSVFVNLNGLLSFEVPLQEYKNDLIFPSDFPVIAPFFADIDTRLSGNVYYRETEDPSVRMAALRLIQPHFHIDGFQPTSVFLVTWDEVGYYSQQYDKTNTFQLAIVSDSYTSYALFLYEDDGITWVRGDGKEGEDVPAQAGFDSGDEFFEYKLPGSGEPDIEYLARSSNVGQAGVWVFRIGYLEGNIELPDHVARPEEPVPRPEVVTCATGGAQTCHASATCTDQPGGYCCKCIRPSYGNGKNCLEPGLPQRLNGKVSGVVNGVTIHEQDLHAYLVTNDGRAYTAISRVEAEIGVAMQAAYTIGGVMGWMFAAPTTPDAKNGFMITGGEFNRTATIRFAAGGETLDIKQEFLPQDEAGYMRVTTRINGNVPNVAVEAEVTVDDYKEEYSMVEPGVIKQYSTQRYRVNGVARQFTVDQTIRFRASCAEDVGASAMLRLTITRNFLVYGEREQIVRYASTNKIATALSGADPCHPGNHDCDPNALCTADGDTYRCDCRGGYHGDGKRCADIDECLRGDNNCDRNAQCHNTDGSFTCHCLPGYRGDGITCSRDLTCADLICDYNARCVYDSEQGKPMCECNPGYAGDGTTCQAVEFSCNEVNNCDPNAECLYNPRTYRYECECVDGFSGDGYSCTDTGEPEINCRNCDRNAQCIYDVERLIFRCQCREGYTGDGYYCSFIEDTCNILNNCGENARCVQDASPRGYTCVCEHGYVGDGYRCEPEGCDTARNCDVNARCVYDNYEGRYTCVCNTGLAGDGYRCFEEGCDVRNYCDVNAQCLYDPRVERYTCVCNEGSVGDGRTCQQESVPCNEVNNCDPNADCLYEPHYGEYVCKCHSGFEGDGYNCRSTGDCSRDPGLCDQNAYCTVRANQYVCVCTQGYRGDGRRCQPIGDRDSYLIYAQGMSIMQVPFRPTEDNPGKITLTIPGQTAIGIDVDCYSRYFYWTDVTGKSIHRARLDGTDSESLVAGLGSPEGIAVDWIAKNMYWTDSVLDRVEVSKVDGTNRKTLIGIDLANPRAIAVDPSAGLIFWTDWNRNAPKVEKAYMDGENRQVLVSENLGLPNGLTLDYAAKHVCWADAGTQHVECAQYDGRGRRTIYALAQYPFGLVHSNDVFYWTDWDMKTLPNIGKYGGEKNDDLILPDGGNGKHYGIASVKSQCPAGSNACVLNNGGCRFLCLPTPNGGRTCACPDDIDEEECNRIALIV